MHETLESLLGEKIETAKQKLVDSLAANSPQQERAQKAMELASKQAELQMAEQVRQMIKERADLFTTEQQAPSGVTVISPAQPPMRPKSPFQQMAASGLGGFVIHALLALFWEYRVQRVVMAQQLSRAAALPILSEVPNLPLKPRLTTTWSGRAFSRQLGLFEDSIHYLCRSLMLSREADGIRTVAVTSAISGEGKTSVALQLARSLALCSHEPVLLVDGDLRKAGLHGLLNLPAGPGLADLLAKESADRRDLETTIISQRFAPIHVLAAGNVKRHPHFILQQDKLEAVFKSLGQMYRYIVVDTPPVLGVGEALSVCKAADGTLICAMRDVSRQSQVEAACQKLFSANARPIGFVLNGVPSEKYASRYGSDYHARQYIEASGSNGHSHG
jgi:capsular exopolysaccharide synthesis family protein